MRAPTERDILRRLGRNEEEAVANLLRLLEAARADLMRRLVSLPEGYAEAEVIVAMRVAIERSILWLNGGMRRTLVSSAAQAVRLGTALADASLPANLLATFSLNPFMLALLEVHTADLVTGLTEPLRAQLVNQIQIGFLTGEGPREVAQRVMGLGIKPVGPFRTARARAEAIARTEMNQVCNTAHFQRGQDAATRIPGLRKRWLATADLRTRPSHVAANGQEVLMNEDFTVGGNPCSHPLDPRLPAEEAVHCRCRLQLIVPEED